MDPIVIDRSRRNCHAARAPSPTGGEIHVGTQKGVSGILLRCVPSALFPNYKLELSSSHSRARAPVRLLPFAQTLRAGSALHDHFPIHWSTQSFTVLYQSCEFCGLKIQWP